MGMLASHLNRSLSGRWIAGVAIIAGTAVLGGSQIPAAAAPLSSGSGHHATAPTPRAPRTQYPCSPLAQGDNVHISSTNPPLQASGHAWWLDNGCNEPNGHVCITLQEKLSGTWHNENTACKTLAPGKPNKVPVQKGCITNGSEWWRSYVTVKTSGALGYGSGFTYTPEQAIGCTA